MRLVRRLVFRSLELLHAEVRRRSHARQSYILIRHYNRRSIQGIVISKGKAIDVQQ
jgi:hypothetical protein